MLFVIPAEEQIPSTRSQSMITLHHARGAGDFSVQEGGLPEDQARKLLQNAASLLRERGSVRAADLLAAIPFRVAEASNHFGDEFSILYAELPLQQYENARRSKEHQCREYALIAETVGEIGPYIRFIAVELRQESIPQPTQDHSDRALKRSEILKLVNGWIGVARGYLGDFTYRSLQDFYVNLDIDANPQSLSGTTRERFMAILNGASVDVQARILEGVLERFPVGSQVPEGSSANRTPELHVKIKAWITRLRTGGLVETPVLQFTSALVDRALLDAQELLRTTGATSGVDRIHTALHGYLRLLCSREGIATSPDSPATELFKRLRAEHSAFQESGPREDDIKRILLAFANVIDATTPLRNKASLAHPNPQLLAEPEARLVINVVRTILHYLDEKVALSRPDNARTDPTGTD